jgi:hypothetical protein
LAPPSILACDAAVTHVEARVRAGTPAVFKLAQSGSVQQHESVLTALASGTEVIATLRIASSVEKQVSIDIKAAVLLNCVLLTVSVPPATPDGALIIIKNVWVAGVAVILNKLASTITIGFNHAPAPAGAIFAAARANDLPGLNAALRNGGSTEEKNSVSAKASLPVSPSACHNAFPTLLYHPPSLVHWRP